MTKHSITALLITLSASFALGQNSLRSPASPAAKEPGRFQPQRIDSQLEAEEEVELVELEEEVEQIAAQPAGKRGETEIEGPKKSSQEARLLLHEAAQISQTAKSVEELTNIADLAKRAISKPLTVEELKYGRDLQAWALNKRGEVYAAQSVEFLNQGSEKESAKLDRLALEDFTAAVKLDANRWKAIHNRGVSYGVLGLHEDALADFSRVVQLKPNYANAWFNRAEIQFERGRVAEAIDDYSQVIKLKPNDAIAYRQRGRAQLRLNLAREALADFEQALELNPNDAVSLVQRGGLKAEAGDYTAASTDYRAAIEVDPDCAEAYRGEAWLMATCPQTKYRNTKFAVEMAEQGIELATAQNKNDFTYYDVLAAAYANAGRFGDAQKVLQKAVSHAPLADAAVMKKRLALYAAGRPFREAAVARVQPASAKVQR